MYLALAFAVACTAIVGVPFSGRVVALQAVHFTNYEVALGWTGLPLGTRVLWSLSVEEHFYLLFPLCYVLVRRALPHPARQALVFLGACGALLAWRIFAVTVLHVSADYTTHATDARIDSILFGCVLALWKNPAMPGPQLPARVVWASFFVALGVLVPTLLARGHVFRETLRYTLQGIALAPVFIAAIRFPSAMPFRLLNLPVVRWIGLISYSLYLVHVVIIDALRVRLHGGEMQLTAIALALSIGLSAAIYHTIERPCAKLRKRLSRIPSGA
jgi:peptidoglycan/LPS O-acetylase OafA/YrhL